MNDSRLEAIEHGIENHGSAYSDSYALHQVIVVPDMFA